MLAFTGLETRSRGLLVCAILATLALASGCDPFEQACPEGFWRPRAGEDCVPVPRVDSGSTAPDAGPGGQDAGARDGGPPDAGATADGGPLDGGPLEDGGDAMDGGALGDGGTLDGAISDAAAADSAVGSDGGDLPDAAAGDGG